MLRWGWIRGFQVVTSLQPQIYRRILKSNPFQRSLQAFTGRYIFPFLPLGLALNPNLPAFFYWESPTAGMHLKAGLAPHWLREDRFVGRDGIPKDSAAGRKQFERRHEIVMGRTRRRGVWSTATGNEMTMTMGADRKGVEKGSVLSFVNSVQCFFFFRFPCQYSR